MDTENTDINIADLNENQRRRKYFENNFKEILKEIDSFNEELKINNFSILLYHFYNKNVSYPNKCKICQNSTKFISFNKGYSIYCSRKCAMSDKEIIKKRNKKSKETSLKNWGTSNPMKSLENKKKLEESLIKKYGVSNYSKTDEFKEKTKKTNNLKYKKDWYLQTDEFKSKSKSSNIKKRGVSHHMKDVNVIENLKKENLKKWNVDNFSKTKKYKDLMEGYFNSPKFIENLKNQKLKISEKIIEYYKNYNRNFKFINIDDDDIFYECSVCRQIFKINKQLLYLRNKNNIECCTICNPTEGKNVSNSEKSLLNFIKEIYKGEIIENWKNKFEIDVYLPEIQMGFEYNGIWFHSENFKIKEYHKNKSLYFRELGIKIMHIWEDDWIFKKEIIKSMIKYKLNKVDSKIWARNCEIKVLNNKETKDFLIENHLQGYCNSKVKLGLFYNGVLVSFMSLGSSRNKKNEIEILRFCNKLNTSVVGSFSKLLNYFIINHDPKKIVTYSDISYSDGGLYLKNNFKFEKITECGYYWARNGLKHNRFKFRKSELVKRGYDVQKTESEIMHENGYFKIYNCGNYKFSLTL